jgi:hypothetical protein
MAADGLTKPLTAVKHAEFVKQLRIEVIDVSLCAKGCVERLPYTD